MKPPLFLVETLPVNLKAPLENSARPRDTPPMTVSARYAQLLIWTKFFDSAFDDMNAKHTNVITDKTAIFKLNCNLR